MELNKNSRWIKFYLAFNNYKPSNICDYFWGSVKSIIMGLVVFSALAFIAICMLSPVLVVFIKFEKHSNLGFHQILGSMLWVSLLLGFVIYRIYTYCENRRYNHKKDSLIRSWYKDFKSKHCTLITWK